MVRTNVNLTYINPDGRDIDIVLNGTMKYMSNFLKSERKNSNNSLNINECICNGIYCDECPFGNKKMDECWAFFVLPFEYNITHLQQVYQYIKNGFKEPHSIDVNKEV